MAWRNRIVGHGEESPDQLLANPRNWRIHPKDQQAALSGVLEQVGLVDDVIVNTTTGHIVDGHMRVMLAMRDEQPTIPVTYVELSPEEEALILATLDPIGAMAVASASQLESLLEDVSASSDAVNDLLADVLSELPKVAESYSTAGEKLAETGAREDHTFEEWGDKYKDKTVRAIHLEYSLDEYAEVQGLADTLRRHLGVETTAEVVVALMRRAVGDLG